MAHFTDIATAVAQGVEGDTIEGRQIHWGYGEGDYAIVWVGGSRRQILTRSLVGNVFRFAEASGYVPTDSFIGPEWTTERVLRVVLGEYEIARGAAQADAHERIW